MKINNATKIGLMVMFAAAILLFMTVKAGNFNLFQKGYTIKAVFNDIDGIDTNSPVMFNGYEIGTVESIDIVYEPAIKIILHLFIDTDIKLSQGTTAHIKNLGFMGEKYIALIGGDSDGPLLQPGTVIIGQQPTDFTMLVTKGEQFISKLDHIAANIDERLEVNKNNIDGILSGAQTTLSNMSHISNNVNESLKRNEQSIDSMIKNFEHVSANMNSASDNLEEMSLDLKLNPWKLLRKPKE